MLLPLPSRSRAPSLRTGTTVESLVLVHDGVRHTYAVWCVAVGAGFIHGSGFGINTLSSFVTRSCNELQKLCVAMG